MPMEASIPASIRAANDKLVSCDLASLRWTRPGPARCPALPHSAILMASSTSLYRLWAEAAQSAAAHEQMSTTRAA